MFSNACRVLSQFKNIRIKKRQTTAVLLFLFKFFSKLLIKEIYNQNQGSQDTKINVFII